jgi:oxygen-independent coproporphyrinogen-3 oxidase
MADHAPLAIYIHWPFCKSKCPYCDFNSHVREQVDHTAWQEALLSELKHMLSQTPARSIGSVFFGGGTPSLMHPNTVQTLLAAMPLTGYAEITLEANPTSTETPTFQSFYEAGINRVSIGVQALDDQSLHFLGRNHSAKEALEAVNTAATIFPRYNFDLIYARPNQTLSDWEKELTAAISYTRGHLSLYQLTIEPNTAFHTAYKKGEFSLPHEDQLAELFNLTQDITSAHNLSAYEISNHATPGQESQHNLTYWKGGDYIGIGPGAHGRITLHDGSRIATETLKSPERWLHQTHTNTHGISSKKLLTSDILAEESVLMGLRLSEGVCVTELNQKSINTRKQSMLENEGLLLSENNHLKATAKGRLVLNQITAELLS